MIIYAKLEVGLHGLKAARAQDVLERVRELLEQEFGQRLRDDVEVELIESAGTEEGVWG